MTRKVGLGAKLGGGGNVSWRCNFCKHEFMSTYFEVKGHLLALPSCGISSCKAVSVNQRRDMEREDHVGLGKVTAASKKKEDDPLPFLRSPLAPRLHFHLAFMGMGILIKQERGNLQVVQWIGFSNKRREKR